MNRAVALYQSSIGKKAIMAVTGLIGVGFVIVHMIGNLQVFAGPEKLNAYAVLLRKTGALLWMARGILLGAVVIHIVAAYQLTRTSWAGRPLQYKRWTAVGSDYASRTMRWSGPILAIFIVYHLLDFTFGKTNPDYIEGDVYHNLIASFSNPVISGFYIIGMLALGLHLFHGIWSMFQTLGLNDTKYNKIWKSLAVLITSVVVAGNISMPVAVMLGVVK